MNEAMTDIEKISNTVEEQFKRDRTLLSFAEYLEAVKSKPHTHLRSSAQYLVDLFEHYGTKEIKLPTGTRTRYCLFDMPFTEGANKVIGQEKIVKHDFQVVVWIFIKIVLVKICIQIVLHVKRRMIYHVFGI